MRARHGKAWAGAALRRQVRLPSSPSAGWSSFLRLTILTKHAHERFGAIVRTALASPSTRLIQSGFELLRLILRQVEALRDEFRPCPVFEICGKGCEVFFRANAVARLVSLFVVARSAMSPDFDQPIS